MIVRVPVSPHFYLDELVPADVLPSVPADVKRNLLSLCWDVLEPARDAMGWPIKINDAYRPPAHNAEVGGVSTSDHLTGSAADVICMGDARTPWQEATVALFHWLRINGSARVGQLILEDHRKAFGLPSKLWVHVAIPSSKHPGVDSDPNRVLVSWKNQQYEPWRDGLA